MTGRANVRTRQAFLVEHYRPGERGREVARLVRRLRESVAELERSGEPLQFVSCTIVPEDESFLCVLEACSIELVRQAYARAGISFERISAALVDEPARSVGAPGSRQHQEGG
jgi:hypothetical protein